MNGGISDGIINVLYFSDIKIIDAVMVNSQEMEKLHGLSILSR